MLAVKKMFFVPVVTVLMFLSASFACSAAYVSISSGGGGVFDLQGVDFRGVGGTKITITYDAATLANPRVEQGGLMAGALMAVNSSFPGSIILGQASTTGFSGTGSLATIRFDLTGTSLGVIRSVTAELFTPNGIKIPAQQPLIFNPVGTQTQDTADQPGTKTTDGKGDQQKTDDSGTPSGGSGGGTASNLVGGTVTMPGDGPTGEPKGVHAAEEPPQQKEAPGAPDAGEAGDKLSSGSAPAGEAEKKPESGPVSSPGVLERFRTFNGNRTVQALVALFDNNDMKGIRQEPPVALSDGVTPVRLFVSLPAGEKDAPNFAFRNVKYLSLKMTGDNSWLVEVLPDKGTFTAVVKMLRHGALTDVPLTVAPPLPGDVKIGTGGKLTEADFTTFLKERGTDKAPRFDLNGDGKRDYVDDYIFTANYLVMRDSGKKANIKEQK